MWIILQFKISSCETCSKYIQKNNSDIANSNVNEPANDGERIRELELELAQTKLAHVEAECRNQVQYLYIFNMQHI